jgi:hypothetical protein
LIASRSVVGGIVAGGMVAGGISKKEIVKNISNLH